MFVCWCFDTIFKNRCCFDGIFEELFIYVFCVFLFSLSFLVFFGCFLVVFLFLGVFTGIFKICILFRVFFCNISENGCFLRMCFFSSVSEVAVCSLVFKVFFYSYFLSFSRYFLLLVFSMFLCVVFCL